MARDAKLERLAALPLFSGSGRRDLERIARRCTEVSVPAGRVLCREGEAGLEFFVLESGSVTVTRGGTPVTTLGPGDFFGELALLDGGTRNATVTAETDVDVIVLSRQEFAELLDEEPAVAARMMPAIGARLRAASAPDSPPVV